MASLIILALYAIIILSYVVLAFFIIYHLVNYGISSEFKVLMLILFIILALGLLVINMAYFFSVDWKSLFTQLSL
jgi:hypothetical protein